MINHSFAAQSYSLESAMRVLRESRHFLAMIPAHSSSTAAQQLSTQRVQRCTAHELSNTHVPILVTKVHSNTTAVCGCTNAHVRLAWRVKVQVVRCVQTASNGGNPSTQAKRWNSPANRKGDCVLNGKLNGAMLAMAEDMVVAAVCVATEVVLWRRRMCNIPQKFRNKCSDSGNPYSFVRGEVNFLLPV